MDLKEFIKTALLDIVQAIEEAKSELKADNICPTMAPCDANKSGVTLTSGGIYYQRAEFDIAVTAENKTGSGGKASLKVLGLEANLGSDLTLNTSTVSRIKFHVPLGLPCKRQEPLK